MAGNYEEFIFLCVCVCVRGAMCIFVCMLGMQGRHDFIFYTLITMKMNESGKQKE